MQAAAPPSWAEIQGTTLSGATMSDVFNLVDDEDEFLLQDVDHAFMLSPPLPSVPGTSEPPVLLATRPDAPKIRVIVRKRPLNKKVQWRGGGRFARLLHTAAAVDVAGA